MHEKATTFDLYAIGTQGKNGIAEHFIGTITQRARIILLHAMAKFPDMLKEEMRTYAL
jgi:hypothetical protein